MLAAPSACMRPSLVSPMAWTVFFTPLIVSVDRPATLALPPSTVLELRPMVSDCSVLSASLMTTLLARPSNAIKLIAARAIGTGAAGRFDL